MKPVKIGIIGLGRAGFGMHCSELESRKDKFQIVAACDLIDERLEKMKKRYGCKTYKNYKDLIADPEVELVDVATRSCDHFEHALAALEAGKDVFQEKPMSTSDEQSAILLEKGSWAKEKGHLYIRQNRRFEGNFNQVKGIIDSGILGDVFLIKLNRQFFDRRFDWQTLREFKGGMSLNWGPHIFDHALQFLGYDVKEQFSDLKKTTSCGDGDDHVHVIMKNSKGLTVDLEILSGVVLPNPTYQVYGTRGALENASNGFKLKYLDPNVPLAEHTGSRETPGDSFGSGDKLVWIDEIVPYIPEDLSVIWDHLYDAIRNNIPFPVKNEESAAAISVIKKARLDTDFD